MRLFFRRLLLYLIVSLVLSVVSFYIIAWVVGTGTDKIGDIMLAMFVSPIIGFLVSIPITIYLHRFIKTK